MSLKVNSKEDLKTFKEEIEEMSWIEVLENFTPHIDSTMKANIRRKFDMRMYVPAVSNSSSDIGLPNFQKAIRYAYEQNAPLHVFVQENIDGYMAAAYLGLQSVQVVGSTFGWNLDDTFDPANKLIPDLRYHPIDEVAPYDDLVLAMRREIHLIREGNEYVHQHQEDEEKFQPDHVYVILGVSVPDINKFVKDCRVYRKDRMRILILNPVVPSLNYEDLKEKYGNDLEIISYTQPTHWSAYQSLILSYNQRLQQGLDDPAWISSTKLPLFMQEAFRWLDRKHVCTWDLEKIIKMDPCMRGFFFYVGYRKCYNNIWWDKEELLNNFVTLARWFAFRVRIEICGTAPTAHQWMHFLKFDHLAETLKISNLYSCEMEQMFVTMGWCHMVSLYEKIGLIIRDIDAAHFDIKLNVGSETITLPDHPVNVKQVELSDLDRSYEIAEVAVFRFMLDYTAIRYVVATYTMTFSDKDVTVTTLIDRKKLPAKDKAFKRKERIITSSADLSYLFGVSVPAEKYVLTKETNYKGLADRMPNWYDLKPDWVRKL